MNAMLNISKLNFLLIVLIIANLALPSALSLSPRPRTIESCNIDFFSIRDDCFARAVPEKLEDCELIPKNFSTGTRAYEQVLTKCYRCASFFDIASCDKLPLDQKYKDECSANISTYLSVYDDPDPWCESPETFEECDLSAIKYRDYCFASAVPEKLEDCELIPKNSTYENAYEAALTNCHRYAYSFDNASCDKLPLNQTYKESCYISVNQCGSISSLELRDKCFFNTNKCEQISAPELQEKCSQSMVKTYSGLTLKLAVLVAFAVFIIALITRTILDYMRKKPVNVFKRIGLLILGVLLFLAIYTVLFLIVHW
jgi:hypothetical protein